MAATITVERIGEGEYRVRVVEGKNETQHRVTLDEADYQRISGGKTTPEELIKRSFEFLLENEPKESILRQFNLTVINQYFPKYEIEIRRRIS